MTRLRRLFRTRSIPSDKIVCGIILGEFRFYINSGIMCVLIRVLPTLASIGKSR